MLNRTINKHKKTLETWDVSCDYQNVCIKHYITAHRPKKHFNAIDASQGLKSTNTRNIRKVYKLKFIFYSNILLEKLWDIRWNKNKPRCKTRLQYTTYCIEHIYGQSAKEMETERISRNQILQRHYSLNILIFAGQFIIQDE